MQDADSKPFPLAAIVNNIPALAQTLKSPPGLATVLSIVAVALGLVTNWERS